MFPEIDIKVTGDIDKYITLDKQFVFATAVALTKVAQDAQANEVPEELKKHFKLRSEWWRKDRKFGIKITPAKKTNLVAEVRTAADWLIEHETDGGATRKPYSRKRLSVPEGEQINPPRLATADPPRRNPSGIIAKAQRPGRLLSGATGKRKYKGRPFKMKFPSGTVWLAKRVGKALLVKWFQIPTVKIKENKTLEPATFRAVEKNFGKIFDKALTDAINTAKTGPLSKKTP